MGVSPDRPRRMLALALCSAAIGALTLPAAASASFHLMSIREVFPGSTANSGQDYVELQMYSSGQNFVGGHSLTVYAANGTVADTATFPSDLPNGANQQTILIGAASSVFGVTPDLVDSGLTAIKAGGGAVCWASGIDCVSWGSFSGSLPSPAGAPAPAIPDGDALRRTIKPHCSSLLEAADDTDDSATDLLLAATPKPRNNASVPTEETCFDTQFTATPNKRTHDHTPTFEFKSVPAGAPAFQCRIDSASYADCSSPFTLPRQALGRHVFRVRALNAGGAPDPTPAKYAFRIVS